MLAIAAAAYMHFCNPTCKDVKLADFYHEESGQSFCRLLTIDLAKQALDNNDNSNRFFCKMSNGEKVYAN